MASPEVGHHALVDLPREEAFQKPDDFACGPAVCRASSHIGGGRRMVPHADDDGSMEGGVGLSVAAAVEAMAAGGHPRRSGDGTRAAELREGGFGANPVGVIAEDDEHFRGGIGADPESVPERRRRLSRESREMPVGGPNLVSQIDPAAGQGPERVFGRCRRRVD